MIPRVRRTMLVVTAIGVCVASLAQVATVALGHDISLFVHLTRVVRFRGLIRLYSGADWIISAGVPFGRGVVLFGAGRRERLAGAIVGLCSFSALAVELTRALYVGIAVGLAATTVLWLAVGDAPGRAGRRRALKLGATLVLMLAASGVPSPLYRVYQQEFGFSSGVLTTVFGVYAFSLLASLLVVGLMLRSAYGLLRDSGRVFLEAAPKDLDPDEIGQAMIALPEVREVHDLHVWEVTSGFPALSAHVLVGTEENCHATRRELEALLHERFGLDHTTLQVDHEGSELLAIELPEQHARSASDS